VESLFTASLHISDFVQTQNKAKILTKFYNKFFPISRINEFYRKISSFSQKEDEKLCDSWERFKELTMKCPLHGFKTWRLIQFFYNGLTQPEHYMIESMNGRGFLNLTGEDAYKTLDELFDNSQWWDFSSHRGKYSTTTKKEGLYEVKDNEDIRGQLKDIMGTVEAIALNKPVTAANIYQADVCSLCTSPMHFTQNCPSLSTGAKYPPEQVNAFNDYRKPTSGPFAETYNPGWPNHPNFSWKQNQPQNQGGTLTQAHNQYPFGFPSQAQNQFRSSHQAQPPAFQSTTQVPQPQLAPQSSLEETIKAFIQTSNQNIQGLNQNIQELQKGTMSNSQNLQELKNATMSNSQNLQEFKQFTHQAIAKMEGQIGQLANQVGERERGKFLSQPGAQPKRAICYWEYIRPFSWAGACASHHNFEVWNASG
jgi:hypothetical protein